jgi:hypothetical protein
VLDHDQGGREPAVVDRRQDWKMREPSVGNVLSLAPVAGSYQLKNWALGASRCIPARVASVRPTRARASRAPMI